MKKYIIWILLIFSISAASAQNDDWRNRYYYFNDFINNPGTSNGGADLTLNQAAGVNTFANVASTSANIVGLIQGTTSTSSTGRIGLNSGMSAVRLGAGSWVFECNISSISALCTAAQGYTIKAGFFDTNSADNQTDGVYFIYDSLGVSTSSASSDRWQCATASNGSRTFFETSVDVVAASATGTKLRIEINADATQADFYIDDVLVRSETATIPSGSGRELGFGFFMLKNIGSTAITFNADYIEVSGRYTTTK